MQSFTLSLYPLISSSRCNLSLITSYSISCKSLSKSLLFNSIISNSLDKCPNYSAYFSSMLPRIRSYSFNILSTFPLCICSKTYNSY